MAAPKWLLVMRPSRTLLQMPVVARGLRHASNRPLDAPWATPATRRTPSPSSATTPAASQAADLASLSSSISPPPSSNPSAKATTTLSDLGRMSQLISVNQAARASKVNLDLISSIGGVSDALVNRSKYTEPHHFHVFATKQNTHITLTRPDRSPIMSVSCGNLGFKKAGRKAYDSAFQLASYVLGRIQEQGLNNPHNKDDDGNPNYIKELEVCLRGFGTGREAVTKAILGWEGSRLRGKIVKVSDATRIKFGGTRSRKPRRLG